VLEEELVVGRAAAYLVDDEVVNLHLSASNVLGNRSEIFMDALHDIFGAIPRQDSLENIPITLINYLLILPKITTY
jgi:hypothetical protein